MFSVCYTDKDKKKNHNKFKITRRESIFDLTDKSIEF